MAEEPRSWSPQWIEFSGLPAQLFEKTKGSNGWCILKKIIELDCERNSHPDAVEIPLKDLAERSGCTLDKMRPVIETLRKMKLVACFLPESDEEEALFKVRVPLPTPLARDEILKRYPSVLTAARPHLRYLDVAETAADDEAEDPQLQEIVDLYFNTVGLKMNAFVLDELRMIRTRFGMDEVRNTFRRAQQNEIHSLSWVVKELIRRKRSRGPKNESA